MDRLSRFQNRQDYAFEELVAEIGACIIGVRLGIQPDFDQSAAYIESWLRALKDDKGLIFKAASEAQKAVDFIMAAAEADKQMEVAAACYAAGGLEFSSLATGQTLHFPDRTRPHSERPVWKMW